MVRQTPNNDPSRLDDRSPNQAESTLDRVKNLITYHSDELLRSVKKGAVTPKLVEAFKQARFDQQDLVGLILHGVECSRELGTYCGITTLREKGVLSLECLNKLLSKKLGDPERDKFVQACDALLSAPETSCLGALILSATMYPLYGQGARQEDLRNVSCLLKRSLSYEAFTSWQGLAAQSLFWSYDSVIADASPSSYIVDAQLGSGCFGLLDTSAAKARAVEIVRLFIPYAANSSGVNCLSRPVPSCIWDAFSRADQKVILSKIDTELELLPWAHSVLNRICEQGQEIQNLCSRLFGNKIEPSFDGSLSLESSRDEIAQRFDEALHCMKDLCRFLVDSFEGVSLTRKLKGKLERQFMPDVARSLESLFTCMQNSDPILSCNLAFADYLNQLFETLRIPLDVQRERDEKCPSFFSRVLLPTFRQALANGDLESALSLRQLFPQQVSDSLERDIVDEFVSTNQKEIRAGLLVAGRKIVERELGPGRQGEINSFRSALVCLVVPDFRGAGADALPKAIGLLARALLRRDRATSPSGYWGCQQVGEILLPVIKIPELIPLIGRAVFSNNDKILIREVTGFIGMYNEDSEIQLNVSASATFALYLMCKEFHDIVPNPVTRHVRHDQLMAHHLALAKRRWCVNDFSLEATSATVGADMELSMSHIQEGKERMAHGQLQVARLAKLVTNDRQRIDSTNCQAVIVEAERVAKYMLCNIDSHHFEVGAFQAAFAELLAAFFWGNRFGLAESRLFDVASWLSAMVECKRGYLICGKEHIRGTLSNLLSGPHEPGTMTSLLKDSRLRDLLRSWG